LLASWILHTVLKPAFTGKVFSLTTAPLTATILFSAPMALMLLLTLFILLDETNHQFVYITVAYDGI